MKLYGESAGTAPPFLTSELNEVSDLLHVPPVLIPGKLSPVPIGQEAGWDPELVWMLEYKVSKTDPTLTCSELCNTF
jgi:hypothetical protein